PRETAQLGDPKRRVVGAAALDERQRQPPVEPLRDDVLYVLRREARVEQVVDLPACDRGDALVRRAPRGLVVRVRPVRGGRHGLLPTRGFRLVVVRRAEHDHDPRVECAGPLASRPELPQRDRVVAFEPGDLRAAHAGLEQRTALVAVADPRLAQRHPPPGVVVDGLPGLAYRVSHAWYVGYGLLTIGSMSMRRPSRPELAHRTFDPPPPSHRRDFTPVRAPCAGGDAAGLLLGTRRARRRREAR